MATGVKVAMVTGAGSGVGRAVSLGLLEAGWTVVLVGRREDALRGTVDAAGSAGDRTLVAPADVADPASVDRLFATIEGTFGRLDLLFNNAGTGAPPVPIEELPFEQWKRGRRHQPDRRVPLHAGGRSADEGAERRAAAASSTTARSRPTRRGRTRRRTRRPSTPSPA